MALSTQVLQKFVTIIPELHLISKCNTIKIQKKHLTACPFDMVFEKVVFLICKSSPWTGLFSQLVGFGTVTQLVGV